MKRYCIIGYPVRHSHSPKIHNAAFRKFGIAARYEAIEVRPENLAKFIKTYRRNFSGGNVTIPHKEKIIKFLDTVSPEAEAIGAVNTIVNRNGKLIGYNTDVYGALAALRTKIKSFRGKRAVVVGAGGAARAIIYGLKKAGAKVTILNRTFSHAKKLAREFGVGVIASTHARSACAIVIARSEATKQSRLDILINTTSVGMRSAESPMPQLKSWLRDAKKKPVVMDIVYVPRMTKFLRDAKSAGCKIITGDKMLCAQAKKSFGLWMGK